MPKSRIPPEPEPPQEVVTETEPVATTPECAESAPPVNEETVLRDEILEELVRESDVWEFLDELRQRELPQEERHVYYGQFVSMVSRRPQAEQDALINAGQSLWHYRSETVRRDIDALRATSAEQTEIAPCAACPEFLAEIVYDQGTNRIRYAVYDVESGVIRLDDRVQIGSTIYMPPQSARSRSVNPLNPVAVLKLPTRAAEYGDDAELTARVEAYLDEYFRFTTDAWHHTASAYVFQTWVYDVFDSVSYFRSRGVSGSGKTTLITAMGHICFRPYFAAGATSASPIFRTLDRYHPTLVLDEADFRGNSDLSAEITKILNIGYQRIYSAQRSEPNAAGKDFDVHPFDVYCPKVFAMRRPFPDEATEDRCLTYISPKLATDPGKPLDFDDQARAEALALRNQLLLWRFRRYHALKQLYQETGREPQWRIPSVPSRIAQVLRPLRMLATLTEDRAMDAHWLEQARRLAADSSERHRTSPEGRLVGILIQKRHDRHWPVRDITAAFNEGQPVREHLSPQAVGHLLRTLLGYRSTEFGHENTTVYRVDVTKLAELAATHGGQTIPDDRSIETAGQLHKTAIPPSRKTAIPPLTLVKRAKCAIP